MRLHGHAEIDGEEAGEDEAQGFGTGLVVDEEEREGQRVLEVEVGERVDCEVGVVALGQERDVEKAFLAQLGREVHERGHGWRG